MRPLLLLIVTALSLINCKEATGVKSEVEKAIVISNVKVSKKELVLNQIEGKWYYKKPALQWLFVEISPK